MNIIEQLTYIYHNFEGWHKNKLSKEDSNKYHERLLMQGNILTIIEGGELKAYLEIWKINYEQLGRLLCGLPFYVFDEDIIGGEIAYVSNGWVSDNYNNTDAHKVLMGEFINKFKDCKFVARKRYKYNESFKVYPINYLGV